MEKADAVFQEELKVMHFFYGPAIFEMHRSVVATNGHRSFSHSR